MGTLVDSLVIGKVVVIRAIRKIGVVLAVGKVVVRAVGRAAVAVKAVRNLVADMVIDIELAEHSQAAVGLKLRRLVASILAAGYILQVVGSRVKVESALARRAARNLVERKAIRNQVGHQ